MVAGYRQNGTDVFTLGSQEHGPQSVDIPVSAAEMRQHLYPGFPLKLGSAHHWIQLDPGHRRIGNGNDVHTAVLKHPASC